MNNGPWSPEAMRTAIDVFAKSPYEQVLRRVSLALKLDLDLAEMITLRDALDDLAKELKPSIKFNHGKSSMRLSALSRVYTDHGRVPTLNDCRRIAEMEVSRVPGSNFASAYEDLKKMRRAIWTDLRKESGGDRRSNRRCASQ